VAHSLGFDEAILVGRQHSLTVDKAIDEDGYWRIISIHIGTIAILLFLALFEFPLGVKLLNKINYVKKKNIILYYIAIFFVIPVAIFFMLFSILLALYA